jgi:hypothetical protein
VLAKNYYTFDLYHLHFAIQKVDRMDANAPPCQHSLQLYITVNCAGILTPFSHRHLYWPTDCVCELALEGLAPFVGASEVNLALPGLSM